jgi:hypothetical protein
VAHFSLRRWRSSASVQPSNGSAPSRRLFPLPLHPLPPSRYVGLLARRRYHSSMRAALCPRAVYPSLAVTPRSDRRCYRATCRALRSERCGAGHGPWSRSPLPLHGCTWRVSQHRGHHGPRPPPSESSIIKERVEDTAPPPERQTPDARTCCRTPGDAPRPERDPGVDRPAITVDLGAPPGRSCATCHMASFSATMTSGGRPRRRSYHASAAS